METECKYCGLADFIKITDKEYVCTKCGLMYLKHRSLKTDKIKYIPEEWD